MIEAKRTRDLIRKNIVETLLEIEALEAAGASTKALRQEISALLIADANATKAFAAAVQDQTVVDPDERKAA